MTEKKSNEPEAIEDADLDEASGGIHLLVPAVQGVCDATAKTGSATQGAVSPSQVNLGVRTGDGSV